MCFRSSQLSPKTSWPNEMTMKLSPLSSPGTIQCWSLSIKSRSRPITLSTVLSTKDGSISGAFSKMSWFSFFSVDPVAQHVFRERTNLINVVNCLYKEKLSLMRNAPLTQTTWATVWCGEAGNKTILRKSLLATVAHVKKDDKQGKILCEICV